MTVGSSHAGPSTKPPPSHRAFSRLQFSYASSGAQLADENDVIPYDAHDGAADDEDYEDEAPQKAEEKVASGGWLEEDDIEDA